MSERLRLDADSTEKLESLSNNLKLRRNVICRIAISMSLMDDNYKMNSSDDTSGIEFNKSTIMGNDEFIFLAMIALKKGQEIEYEDSFNTVVRYHIIRGLQIMDALYKKLNSPTDFFENIIQHHPKEEELVIDNIH
jgi:DNA sulfur modification protein DndE